MRMLVKGLASAAVAVLTCHGTVRAAVPDGTPFFIPLPPGTLAHNLGANGFVVGGAFYHPEGKGPALHWMPTSGVTEIGGARAVSVSRDGKTLVGVAFDGAELEHAAIWTGGRGWRLLGSIRPDAKPCDLLVSGAFGASDDARVIVGLAWDGCSHARAFRWEESTGMVDLGSLGGGSTRANGVSGDGRVVVGWEQAPNGVREGVKWTDGREERILGANGPVGEAFGANRDASMIVGMRCDPTTSIPTAWTLTPAAGGRCFPVVRPIWAPALPYKVDMYATSDDGRVIVGAISFGLDAEAVVWFDGEPFFLRDYLCDRGLPDAFRDWYNTGFAVDVSPDGRTIVGFGVGPGSLRAISSSCRR